MLDLNYLLPLAAALFYTLSTLFVKRALTCGAGIMCVVFVANWMIVPFFLPLFFIDSGVSDWSLWGWAFLAGFMGFLGMVLTFVAVRIGDLSIQTPVMGSKVVFVGIISVMMGATPMTGMLWMGAALSMLGVIVLSKPQKKARWSKRLVLTLVVSVLNAASFAVSDVVIEKYAPLFGESAFLLVVALVTGLMSFALIPFFEHPLRAMPKASWKWVIGGNLLMALEAVTLYAALAFYGEATAVNIMYGSRGIWAVLLVWVIGKYFISDGEAQLGKRVMIRRFLGALLLFLAIVLVILNKA